MSDCCAPTTGTDCCATPVDERTANFKRGCLFLIELVIEKTSRAGATGREQEILANLAMVIGETMWVSRAARKQQQPGCLNSLAGDNENCRMDAPGITAIIIIIGGYHATACITVQTIDMRIRSDIAIAGSHCTIQQCCP